MEALHEVVRAGKARYVGASSMYAWQFAKAQRVAPTPFVSMQNHYNLIYREEEREMIPQCLDMGVGVIPWSPLARGFLAGSPPRPASGTTRAETDPFLDSLYRPDSTSPSSTAPPRSRRSAASRRPGRARLAPPQAGRDGADRRRVEDRTRRGCARGRDAGRWPTTRSSGSRSRTSPHPTSGIEL